MSACVEGMVGSDVKDKCYKVLILFTRQKFWLILNFKL